VGGVGQRCAGTQSGLGYLLENRLAVSRQFPQAFQALQVQRLAGTYRALMDSLQSREPRRRRMPTSPCSRPARTTKPISSTPTWRATWV